MKIWIWVNLMKNQVELYYAAK